MRRFFCGALACGLIALVPLAAAAEDFYHAKTITIVTSTDAGGSYDLVARLMARTMPTHIPGHPVMIVQNMPGGGNVLATNYMYNVAPKDGTVIATVNMGMPLHQVIDGRGVRYDAARFNWLGSTGPINAVAVAWHDAGIGSIAQAMQREVTVGGTGPASALTVYPMAMNKVLGTRFKIVTGYKSSAEIYVAMEKGEVEARAGSLNELLAEHEDWVEAGKVDFLVQVGETRSTRLPYVPLMTELAQNDAQRRILALISSPQALGQAYLAPPEVPADRLAILRQAFAATLRDPAFVGEAAHIGLEIEPMSDGDVLRIIRETMEAPPAIIALARAAITPKE